MNLGHKSQFFPNFQVQNPALPPLWIRYIEDLKNSLIDSRTHVYANFHMSNFYNL